MYPKEYVAFLIHFHGDRDYFECHEILEEYWKGLPAASRDSVWVGLIQIAVSLYHQRRGNFPGAAKMMGSAIRILSDLPQQVKKLGLDSERLLQTLRQKLGEIEANHPYASMNLPIADASLLAECRRLSLEKGFPFGQESDLSDQYLVHKHTLRDRQEVIAERAQRLKEKEASRKKA